MLLAVVTKYLSLLHVANSSHLVCKHFLFDCIIMCCFIRKQVRAFMRGARRAAAAVGARAQLLRGAHDALGGGALALHYGRLRLQGLHAEGHAAQAGRRAQPRRPVRQAPAQHKAHHRRRLCFYFPPYPFTRSSPPKSRF